MRRDELDQAIEAGILDRETGDALAAFLKKRRAAEPRVDERFRLFEGFDDIFAAVACILVLLSAAELLLRASPMFGDLGVAILAWFLADRYTRRRPMPMPAFVVALLFILSMVWQIETWGIALLTLMDQPPMLMGIVIAVLGALLVMIATSMLWYRFYIPITVAAGWIAVGYVFTLTLVSFRAELSGEYTKVFPFLIASWLVGGAMLVAAVRADIANPTRVGRKADVAFWMHVGAALLFIHPWFGLLAAASVNIAGAALMALVYGLLTAFSLAIDRRALLLSASVYLGIGLAMLTDTALDFQTWGTWLILLLIGLVLLALSDGWQWARAHVLTYLPEGWRSRLPPMRT